MAVANAGEGVLSGTADAPVLLGQEQGGTVFIDDARLLTMGDYGRSGPDLTITSPDGDVVVVKGYFLTDTPPDLVGPQGMVISGHLAERLAGPRVPGGQIAQAGDQIAQAAPIGSVEKVDGTVTIERADGTVVELAQGDAIYEGDIVITGADGKVGLVFLDGSEFSLGGNGRMVLDEMVYDPNSGDGSSSVSLLSGTFSFISGQIAKASPDGATVNTPIATIGIRGTSGTIRIAGEEVGATEQLQVVLIPDPGGSVGEIIITTPGGQVTTLNVPFNGLNMIGGLVQTFTISAEDFVQEYGQAVDYLRSDFGNTLPPQPNQGPGDTGGPNNGQNDQQDDQNSGQNDQEFQQDVVKVVLNDNDHGIPVDPEIVPERDYERPPRAPNPEQDRDGGFYQEDDEQAAGEDEDDNEGGDDVVEEEPGRGIIVTGSSRGDTIEGSAGADSIFGGEGGDTLVASAGNDILNGGDGADWVSYSAFTANLSINLSQGTVAKGVGAAVRAARASGTGETGTLGTDTLISIENISGGSGDDTFIGDAGNNTFIGGAGRDTLSHVGQTASVNVNMTTGVATGSGIGTDRFSGFENVIGGAGDDTFVGDAGNNTIVGGAGRDTVSFAAQTSGVSVNLATGVATGAGIGRDTLWGIETVIGGSGDDAFVGDAGDNAFIGGAGHDTVSYATQTAGITVNAATGVVTGSGIGTDTVSGIEYFIGGLGNDTFIAGQGGNVFVGGAGSDTVSYAGKTGSVIVDLSSGYGGAYSYYSASVSNTPPTIDRLEGIENAIGGSGYDYFVGNASNNTFFGGAGIDTVGYENDTAGVTVNLTTGTATGLGIGTDKLVSIENVFGGAGNDVLTGSAGQNYIDGGAGNDTIIHTGGGDYLRGGTGTDTLVFKGTTLSQDSGVFTDFEVIDLRGGQSASLELTPFDVMVATGKFADTTLRVRGDGGDEVFLSGGEWGHAGTTTIKGITYDVYQSTYGGSTITVQLESGLYDAPVVETNEAPVLVSHAGGDDVPAPSLGTVAWNPGEGHTGTLVSDLLVNATDSDGDALGVAIVGADATHGTWEYSLDSGSSWVAMGTTSSSAALLLGADARIRFTPTDETFDGGDVAVVFHAWDGSDGMVSGTSGVDVTAAGGTTAYSDTTETAVVTVDEPNDAPILGVKQTVYWQDMESDPGWSGLGSVDAGGWAWGSALGEDDPASGAAGGTSFVGFNLSDLDWGDYPADMADTVYVTTGEIAIGGADWVSLRYQEFLGLSWGDFASVEVSIDGTSWTEVWSTSDDDFWPSDWTPVEYDLSSYVGGQQTMYLRWGIGPTDQWSQSGGWNIDDVEVVTGDVPVSDLTLNPMARHPVEGFHNGTLVSDLTGNAADADGDALGIAIVGADQTDGTWEYSLDDGTSWTSVGTVSTGSALLLDGSARVRFTPTSDVAYEGGEVGITFHAWDGTDGNASGTSGVDVSSTGGRTAYSENTNTAIQVVAGPNMAPEVLATPPAESFDQGEEVSTWVADLNHTGQDYPATSDSDGPFYVDRGPEGYAIIGCTGAGTWEYTMDGGTTWTAMPAVSETSAFLISSDGGSGLERVRFVPGDASVGGTATLELKAWDGANYVASGNAGVDTTNDPNNAFSVDSFTRQYVIQDLPDWQGGTAVYDGSTAQWDANVVPTAASGAFIGTSAGETVTFDGTANLTADYIRLQGTANMVVSGGEVTAGDLDTGELTSLTVSGGVLHMSGTYDTSIIDGGLTVYGGVLWGGGSYSSMEYAGDSTALFHDGSSGNVALNDLSLTIASGSTAELYNTSITRAGGSAGLEVFGTLEMKAGGVNSVDAGLNVYLGDNFTTELQGAMVIHAADAAAPTIFEAGNIYSRGTITLTASAAGQVAILTSSAPFWGMYNYGGLIHATGAAGAEFHIDRSLNNQANYRNYDMTGLIQVDSGVTLFLDSGNTIVTREGADYLVDGTFQNDGMMMFEADGTDLGGTGTYINNGSMSLSGGVTVTVTGAELVNAGVITSATNSTIDLDADNDGLNMGTFTNAGGTTNSVNIGNSPGLFTVEGHYGIRGEGTGSVFEIAGTEAGTGHDALVVTGTMHRAGTVDVTEWAGYVPTAGDSFDIIRYGAADGRFHHVEGLDTWLDDGIGMGVSVDADGVTLTAHAVTKAGTAGGDTLVGGVGQDVLAGFDGDDVLVSNGGNDLLFGGAGNDRFVISDTAFNHIDGGAGTDTLVVNGSIDLSGLGGELFSSLERISLEGAGAQSLVLDSHIVQSMSRDTNDLIIQGAANDSVTLEGAWNDTGASAVVDGVSYSIWSDADSAARVLVQDGMAAAATA